MSAHITSERLLNSVLEALSDPAILVEPSRRILASNRAFRCRFSAGEDPRGRFCFEMTHGRCVPCKSEEVGRCPLDGRGVEIVLHEHDSSMGEVSEEVFAHPVEGHAGTVAAFLLVTHPLSCTIQLAGRSRAFTRMMALTHHASAGVSPVLLWGEPGSGKTCVARALHNLSSRSQQPFVVAYCAASSEKVLGEELFGLEGRGAGVEGRRRGLIQSAQGGTLLLRGVSELPVGLVPRIVDVITNGIFEPVGGKEELSADVRWVLAAERSDESRVGWALPDLLRIAVPALRRRRQDIPILVDRMIKRFGEDHVRSISDGAVELLRRHSFPGNVRELEGLMERACMLADGEVLLPEHFPDLAHTVH